MLRRFLLGLAVALILLLGFAATRPGRYHVERTITVAAPSSVVFAQVDDLHAWAAWSPWEKLDPAMHKSFAGPSRGVGASYAWQGNDQVGAGKMTIIAERPPHSVRYKLEFRAPFVASADGSFTFARNGASSTVVTWAMDGANNFVGKLFSVFMDMDTRVGGDFERGLAQLKAVAEREAGRSPANAAPAASRHE